MPTSSDICVFCGNNCSSAEDLAAHIAEKHVRQVGISNKVTFLLIKQTCQYVRSVVHKKGSWKAKFGTVRFLYESGPSDLYSDSSFGVFILDNFLGHQLIFKKPVKSFNQVKSDLFFICQNYQKQKVCLEKDMFSISNNTQKLSMHIFPCGRFGNKKIWPRQVSLISMVINGHQ